MLHDLFKKKVGRFSGVEKFLRDEYFQATVLNKNDRTKSYVDTRGQVKSLFFYQNVWKLQVGSFFLSS